MNRIILKKAPNNKKVKEVSERLNLNEDIVKFMLSNNYDEHMIKLLTEDNIVELQNYEVKNIEKAADFLIKFLNKKDPIIFIRSDYDSDGVNSAFICKNIIDVISQVYHKEIRTIILDAERNDGYGINIHEAYKISRYPGENKLCMILDNGITKSQMVNCMISNGVDVIVVDHHVPRTDKDTPKDSAKCIVIDPWYNDTENENGKGLCAAALTYLLMKNVLKKLGNTDFIEQYVSNAAVATITDCMPVTELNAIIVGNGIKLLNKQKSTLPINYYKSKKKTHVTPKDIAFELGPQLNACGRMQQTYEALQFLFSRNEDEVMENYESICEINTRRKNIEANLIKTLEKNINENDKVIVVRLEDNASGILGSLAGKLLNKYKRPAILFYGSNGKTLKGSARSIPGISLHDMFNDEEVNQYVKNFGGHEMAAGIEIYENNLNNLKDSLNRIFEDEEKGYKEKTKNISNKTYEVDDFITLHDINNNNINKYSKILFFNDLKEPTFCIKNLKVLDTRNSSKPENICLKLYDEVNDEEKELWAFGLDNKYRKELNSPDTISIVGKLTTMFSKPTFNIDDIIAE